MSSTSRAAVVLPTSSFRIFRWYESEMILTSSRWSVMSFSFSASSMSLARSSFSVPLRAKTLALMTMPCTPGGTRSEVSRTSPAFSPKIARSSFSSGRQLGLALRRDLADQDVARLHLGADADDARLVEVLEGLLADVRDVAGDLFLAELGVAGDALELLDVDRGEDVVLDQALGDEDRVLEVVAAPRHEGDEHVLARAPARPCSVAGPSAMTSPGRTLSPRCTIGFWLMQVFWFERWNLTRL